MQRLLAAAGDTSPETEGFGVLRNKRGGVGPDGRIRPRCICPPLVSDSGAVGGVYAGEAQLPWLRGRYPAMVFSSSKLFYQCSTQSSDAA